MTESTHSLVREIKDDGKRLRGINKGFRGEGSAAVWTRSPQLLDHFLDSTATGANFAGIVATTTGSRYTFTVTGTGTGSIAVSKTASGGILTMTTAAYADQAFEMAGTQLIWEPEELGTGQKLVFEARVRIATLTTVQAFFGWSDVLTAATGTMFKASASSVVTMNPTADAFGFVYSSVPTSGTYDQAGTTTNYFGLASATGGATNTDKASTGVSGDGLFHIFRLEADSAGNVDAFIDDAFVGYKQYVATTSGMKPSIPFTPYFNVVNTTTAARTFDIDYVICHTTMETGV